MNNYSDHSCLTSIGRKNPKLLDELQNLAAKGKLAGEEALELSQDALEGFFSKRHGATESVGSSAAGPQFEGGRRRATALPAGSHNAALEAIVRREGRPTLLVSNGTYADPEGQSAEIKKLVAGFNRQKIDHVIARSARVEFANVPGVPYVGTGWVIEKPSENEAILVTNRHVAFEFASFDGRGGYRLKTLPNFRDYLVNADFREEYPATNPLEAPLVEVLFIAGPRDPDIALFRIKGDAVKDLTPVVISNNALSKELEIGVIGYPANDSRNDPEDMARYFGDIFNVKRFSFGEVIHVDPDYPEFVHDATTLGGNSGSVVFDLQTGEAVGLHFAGNYLVGNYAVPVNEVKKAMSGLSSSVVVPRMSTEARGDGRHTVAHFESRDGYNPAFFGKRNKIEIPGFGKWKPDDLVDIAGSECGETGKELKYRHFSVWMAKERKLPLITAVNIDGAKSKRIGRVDKWYIDERLPDSFQTDNAAYYKNPLDRGHMVRREDPNWGALKTAREANIDTFHYTNCAPQHASLNQRDWVRLENYVLSNARTHRLKVSVFTGPIFQDDDPEYRDLVQLPRAFWKIVAVINSKTKKPSVTGYVLCQGEFIKKLTEAFTYGDFKTYQVPLTVIADQSGLDVAHLLKFDPLTCARKREGLEGSMNALFVPVSSGADIEI